MNVPNFNFDPNHLPSVGGTQLPSAFNPSKALAAADEDFQSGEPGTDYRKLFFLILGLAVKYRWLILGISSIALAIGFLVTFTSTPIYQATTVIQIDPQAAKVVKVDSAAQDEVFGDRVRFYETQYDLLRSRSLAERVAADLDLGAARDFLNPPSTSSWAKLKKLIFPGDKKPTSNVDLKQKKAIATSMVQSGLTITPVIKSSLVRISFESPSPEWARRVADGVADSFVSANLERRYGATAYARNFIKERLDELKLRLEQSEKALVAYAQQKEIIVTQSSAGGATQSMSDSDLASINSELQKVTNERIRAQEQWEQAKESKGLGLPQILNDNSIQTLRARRATLMADYQEKLSTFKPAYPDMLKLKAQIDQIDQQIDAAVNIIKNSLRARYASAAEQEQLLRKKIVEIKAGVFDARDKQIEYNILKREADTNRTLYDGLLQQYKDVGVAGAVGTNNVAIIDRAQLPGGPIKPSLSKNLAIWFVLGLIVAAFGITVLEIVDDTFKSPEEIEEQLGLPVLGIIPISDDDVLVEIMETQNSPIAEAFRSFRTAIQFSTDQGAPKSILVTSARPGEGKSTTALALAINFAQLGMKVLLIDADLRNPSQHRNLKLENDSGLANYLAGAAAPNSVFQQTTIEGLYFMATGPLPPNPAELLAGPRMSSLLSATSEKFDSVVIDSPPVMGLADAPLLSSIAGGTLVVMATGDTRRGVVKAALKRLHFARARMLGAVLNKFDFHTASYGYGYGYGYGALDHYGYGNENATARVEHVAKE